MNIKKLEKQDYGRIALLSFLFKAMEMSVEIPITELDLLLLIISDVIVVVGFICAVVWAVKTIKLRKRVNLEESRVSNTRFFEHWNKTQIISLIYTALNIKLMSPLFFSNLALELDPGVMLVVFIFLFLNTALLLHSFKGMKFNKYILVIYTFLNFLLLYNFVFTYPFLDVCFGCTVTATGRLVDPSPTFTTLFLNAGLILYWLKRKEITI